MCALPLADLADRADAGPKRAPAGARAPADRAGRYERLEDESSLEGSALDAEPASPASEPATPKRDQLAEYWKKEECYQMLDDVGCPDVLMKRLAASTTAGVPLQPLEPATQLLLQLYKCYVLPRAGYAAWAQVTELFLAAQHALKPSRTPVRPSLLAAVVLGIVLKTHETRSVARTIPEEVLAFQAHAAGHLFAQVGHDREGPEREAAPRRDRATMQEAQAAEIKVLQALGWDLGPVFADTYTCLEVVFKRLAVAMRVVKRGPEKDALLQALWTASAKMVCTAIALGQTRGYGTAVEVVTLAAEHGNWEARVPGWSTILLKVAP